MTAKRIDVRNEYNIRIVRIDVRNEYNSLADPRHAATLLLPEKQAMEDSEGIGQTDEQFSCLRTPILKEKNKEY